MDRIETGSGNDSHDRVAQPPSDGVKKILIVSHDPSTLEWIAVVLSSRINVQLSCVSTDLFVSNQNTVESHDLVILDVDGMPDAGFKFHAMESARQRLICLCSEKQLADFVRARYAIAREILVKPVDSEGLVEAVQKALRESDQAIRLATKFQAMRQLVRRVVRERRDLNRRIDLVCRDLVEAHRRLTYRFVELQRTQASQAN